MNADQVLYAGILDLIFDGRNKLYGAYQIRKNYQKRLSISLLIIIPLAIFSIFFLNRYKPVLNKLNVIVFDEPAFAAPPKPDLPQNTQPNKAFKSVKMSKTEVTAPVNAVKIGSRIEFFNSALKLPVDFPKMAGSGVALSNNNISGPLDGENNGINISTKSTLEKSDSLNMGPVENPDILPSFPGGEAALRKFLKKNLQMPEMAQQPGTVKIIARFIINMDGKMSSLTTTGDGDEFDIEVKRVLQKMPPWVPGKSKGRSISCYFKIPIIFNIVGY